MTKNNYKPVCVQRTGRRLGDYIKKVNVRNTENLELPLMGLSIEKCFIPSIANTIGTNMKTYKIIERDQFAYGPVTSRNGDKITIALFDDYDKALISQAYIPFEIKDKEKLLPKYLMMWFSRPEFDRYARFKSHGSARETFDWEEMCDVKLPIPSIEKQREIVADYQAVENKIKTNEAICEKLEETAQTIYRRWFEEFEFPYDFAQGKPDKEGKPYKSNGGVMVWNEELEKEVPKGWGSNKLKHEYNITIGRTPPRNQKQWFSINQNDFKWVSIRDLGENGIFILETNEKLTKKAVEKFKIPIVLKNTIILSFKMSVGNVGITYNSIVTNEAIAHFNKTEKTSLNNEYLYFFLKTFNFNSLGTTSSIVHSINTKIIKDLLVLVPDKTLLEKFHNKTSLFFKKILMFEEENQQLYQLQALLLGRMTREEKRIN